MELIKKIPVGIQFIIFGDLDEKTLAERALTCAEIGYEFVELPLSVRKIKAHRVHKCMQDAGLELRSVHVGYRNIQDEAGLKNTLEYVRDAGASVLISSGLEVGTDTSSFESSAKKLDTIGRQCLSEGVQFYYHIFNWEFEKNALSTKRCIDQLLEGTVPRFVKFNLDLFWAMYAREDPVSLIRSLRNRCDYYHVKDGKVIEEDTIHRALFCPLGEGTVNIRACAEAILSIHDSPIMVVEQDTPSAPNSEIADTTQSLEFLRKLGLM